MNYIVRKDGRVQTKVQIEKGKFRTVTAKNTRELNAKVAELYKSLGRGLDVTATRDTFRFWAEKWLKYKQAEATDRYYKGLRVDVEKLSPLCDIELRKLTPIDLQDILLELAEKYSQKTLKNVRATASNIMEMAIENRAIDYNPFHRVKIPKNAKPPQKRRALTAEEQQRIIDTPHRCQTAAMIMLFAGLRRGELIPLTWGDVDLTNGTIAVSKSVVMENGTPHVKKGGKTASAERVVQIPKILINYLKSIEKNNILVCPSAKGAMMTDTAWGSMWDSYLCDLNIKYGFGANPPSKFTPGLPFNIPRFTAHWLRHTYISMLYMAGVDAMTAKELAGHSDIKTTLSIYTHLSEEHKKINIAKLDDYISNSG